MTTEFVGVIMIDPPFTAAEIDALRHPSEDEPAAPMPWCASRDGSVLRVHEPVPRAVALEALRLLVRGGPGRGGSGPRDSGRGGARFRGAVAGYDQATRELIAVTVSSGRVTVRSLRKDCGSAAPSNVVPLAPRRRGTSRAIG